MDFKKYIGNTIIFIFALVGLIKGCIVAGMVLIVLGIITLPIPQMQAIVDKFLEDSFKQVSEKQPNLTIEQFKKSQKNIFIVFCVIFSLFILFSESESSNTNIQNNIQVQQVSPEYNLNIASETAYKTFTDADGVLKKGYTIKGNLYQTKSKDFAQVYIFGALVEHQGQIYNCLWANNEIDATGMFESINNHAVTVSGIMSSNKVTMSDDGVSRINQKLLTDWDNINKPVEINIAPSNACDYLKSQGFVTDGYKSDGMGGYFCITPYKMLDSLSSIVYSAEGTQNDVEKLELGLTVHNSSNVTALHEQLVSNAKILTKQALNYDLTEENIKAIRNGLNATIKVNDKWNIEITKDVGNSSYRLQFTIKK